MQLSDFEPYDNIVDCALALFYTELGIFSNTTPETQEEALVVCLNKLADRIKAKKEAGEKFNEEDQVPSTLLPGFSFPLKQELMFGLRMQEVIKQYGGGQAQPRMVTHKLYVMLRAFLKANPKAMELVQSRCMDHASKFGKGAQVRMEETFKQVMGL